MNAVNKAKIWLAVSIFLSSPLTVFAQIPNDPNAQQWAYQDVNAYQAWDYTVGADSVVVAVIDNGFDMYHPDISPNLWTNSREVPNNGIDDDRNGYIDDVHGWNFAYVDRNNDGKIDDNEKKGNNDPRPDVTSRSVASVEDSIHHATLVAGIIGAVGNNGLAGAGINWKVKMMNLKIIENTDSVYMEPVINAIYYAVNNGADIINMSIVGTNDQRIKDAVNYAYSHGVAIIAAAGNDLYDLDNNPLYPICADAGVGEQRVLGVSAIDQTNHLAQFSNIGRTCVDITAPGVNINSTLRYAPVFGLKDMYGGGWSGTSFAAPFVTGAAALIKSVQPNWKAKDIYDAILKSVYRTPPQDVAAYEKAYGAGRLQIDAAVKYALDKKAIGYTQSAQIIVPPTTTTPTPNTYVPNPPVIVKPTDRAPDFIYAFGDKNKMAVDNINSMTNPQYGFLRDYDFFTTYKDNGERFFVLTKSSKKITVVKVVSSSGEELNRWEFPQDSWRYWTKYKAVVGDVLGDSAKEIVLYPISASADIFRVFSLDGKELKTNQVAKRHLGVSLTLGVEPAPNKQSIALMYGTSAKDNALYVYKDFNLLKKTSLDLKSLGMVGSGDLAGDGKTEYVIASGAGDAPFLIYFDANGEELRRFSAFSGANKSGISLVMADVNNDGKDEAVVSLRGANQPVRAWNNRSKIVLEWWPFGEGKAAANNLFVWYSKI